MSIPEYLYLTPEQAMARRRFMDDESYPKRKCRNQPKAWADYRRAPSPEAAKAMCGGCLVFDLCREYANVLKPTTGVWHGNVY